MMINFVVGLSFLNRTKAYVFPFFVCMFISNSQEHCFLPMKRDGGVEAKTL